jgi:hypothetical protein
MVHLVDEAQLEARFGPFRDSANHDARSCTVCAEHTKDSKVILDALDRAPRCVICNLLSICLEIVLVSVQDRCTVSAKRTIGLEIILDAPDGTRL